VNSLPQERVIFVPDGNLAAWVARHTAKTVIPWFGNCYVHHQLTAADVRGSRKRYPAALVAVHPECRSDVLDAADYVGSTSGIRNYVRRSDAASFVIGTEAGILRVLRQDNPDKEFHLLSENLICRDMKLCTLQQVRDSLHELSPVITVDTDIAAPARASLTRMLDISQPAVRQMTEVSN
jgi:quinolinate synthase